MNFNIEEAEVAPGYLGLLFDETPKLTIADVKPFVWAILLYRGAVAMHEVVASVTQVCAYDDLITGWSEEIEDDRNRLEWLVGEVLGDMTAAGLLHYNQEKDIWTLVAGAQLQNLPTIIKAVAGTDGSLPMHLRAEL